MKIFGDLNDFAIQYSFENSEKYSTFDLLVGSINIFVKNKNLCVYTFGNKKYKYLGNLFFILECFNEKLEYFIGYDEFPLPIKANNILDLISKAYNFQCENEFEEELWYSALNKFCYNHSLVSGRDGRGNALSSISFRRVKNEIEIYWDNLYWKENENVIFENLQGTYKIDFKKFNLIVKDFLYSLIYDIKEIMLKYEDLNTFLKDDMIKIETNLKNFWYFS